MKNDICELYHCLIICLIILIILKESVLLVWNITISVLGSHLHPTWVKLVLLLLPITFSFFISCTLVSSIIISILRPREKYWDTLNEFRAYHWLLAIAQRPNIPYFSMLALTCAGQTFYDCAQTGVSSRRRAVTVKKPSSFSRGMEYSHILT